MKSTLILAIGGLALAQPVTSAAEITQFDIDSANSYVGAYIFNGWINHGPSEYENGNLWRPDLKLMNFPLGGSFTVETVASGSTPNWVHLQIVDNEVITDAPSYSAFTLPYLFSVMGQTVSYSDGPCFDAGFYDTPGMTTYCSGFVAGDVRNDEGTLVDGVLTVGGANHYTWDAWQFDDWVVLPYDTEPDAAMYDQYNDAVNGLFQYHMTAVAQVPEPHSAFMMLLGIGLVGYVANRRKARS
jgi:hypothetical protein